MRLKHVEPPTKGREMSNSAFGKLVAHFVNRKDSNGKKVYSPGRVGEILGDSPKGRTISHISGVVKKELRDE